MRLPVLPRLGITTLALSIPLSALAQESIEEEPTIVYAEETVLDFERMEVTGQLVRPEGSLVKARRRAEFAPMIALRVDFNEALSESVDLIK